MSNKSTKSKSATVASLDNAVASPNSTTTASNSSGHETATATTTVSVIPEELDCSLCLKLLCEPVSLHCGHTYCKFCVERSIQAKIPKCPLCRADLSFLHKTSLTLLSPNLILQDIIKRAFPTQYAERLEEVTEERNELMSVETITRKLLVGNLAERVRREGESWYKWTMIVRLEADRRNRTAAEDDDNDNDDDDTSSYIKEVTYQLHPTFRPSTVTVTEAPFALSRLGWGVFMIRLTIKFQDKYNKEPLHTTHMLSFNDGGDFNLHEVEFTVKKINDKPATGEATTSTSNGQRSQVGDNSRALVIYRDASSNNNEAADIFFDDFDDDDEYEDIEDDEDLSNSH